jgi:hypothetical protein
LINCFFAEFYEFDLSYFAAFGGWEMKDLEEAIQTHGKLWNRRQPTTQTRQ